MNEAANDSARVSGQDRKKMPALGTNQIARFGEFCPLTSSEKINIFSIYTLSDLGILSNLIGSLSRAIQQLFQEGALDMR